VAPNLRREKRLIPISNSLESFFRARMSNIMTGTIQYMAQRGLKNCAPQRLNSPGIEEFICSTIREFSVSEEEELGGCWGGIDDDNVLVSIYVKGMEGRYRSYYNSWD
jgi:hypothetical protein